MLKDLHHHQGRLLEYLLGQAEGAPIEELVMHLGITKTAVKMHINRLQDLGYLTFKEVKGKVGRPHRYYFLSEEGIEIFPKKYSWLSNVILAQLTKELDSEGLARFMRTLADTVADSTAPELSSLSDPFTRLKKITAILNELGYKAVLKENNGDQKSTIEAVNCIYHSVAKEHPALCQFDIRFIEKTSGMSVRLESCIAKGGSVCRFCLAGPSKKKVQ